ncbi:glycosyltransferase family 2 protein [Candidatus Solirubrobacter pratensis]|uniref:glycosyltransferase family 2 protein n=1 Tax=Candidatus Solirubrobacter pratensis TaxID=1298857 RepID=UPI00041500C7|nr:glycosyltransferase family 2 protein [Candidatus Solirubrobacter pratensis]
MFEATAAVAVSVVICAYADRRWPELQEAVESVRAQSLPPLETIVVIDHNPALLELARRGLPGAIVIENEEPRGLSGARNSGLRRARGAVVAFLDDDAIAEPDWLQWLAAPYAEPEVLGVGGAIEPRWAGERPAAFPPEFQWVVGCSYEGLPTRRAPVRNVIGASMSMRRDVFELAGGFQTGIGRVGPIPLGCEETELCIRARRRRGDGVFLYEPRSRVAHRVPEGRTTWSYFCSRCFAEGISKARVSSAAGPGDALASEREYVRRTLPAGVLRGIGDARRGDPWGLARATAIVMGLALTTLGYVAGSVAEVTARARKRDERRSPP